MNNKAQAIWKKKIEKKWWLWRLVTILLWSYLFVQMMSHIHCIVDQLNFTKKNLILNFYHFIYILIYSAYFLYPLAFIVLLVVFLLGHFKKDLVRKKFTFYLIVIFTEHNFSLCELKIFDILFWPLVGREGRFWILHLWFTPICGRVVVCIID